MSAALKRPPTSEVAEAEWRTRCDLAALYHVVHHLGWTDLINTHMSARVRGEPDRFLINRYGEMFDEITASSLVKMDLQGNVIGDQGRFNDPSLLVMSSLADGPKHGYAMTKDIQRFAGVTLGPGTLYGALTRLQHQGLIEALPADDRRRPYRLSDRGTKVLAAQLESLQQVATTGLDRLARG